MNVFRLLAVLALILALAGIIYGRAIGHNLQIAIVGYVLLAIAIVLGLISRR